jgi:hypothetical protein
MDRFIVFAELIQLRCRCTPGSASIPAIILPRAIQPSRTFAHAYTHPRSGLCSRTIISGAR